MKKIAMTLFLIVSANAFAGNAALECTGNMKDVNTGETKSIQNESFYFTDKDAGGPTVLLETSEYQIHTNYAPGFNPAYFWLRVINKKLNNGNGEGQVMASGGLNTVGNVIFITNNKTAKDIHAYISCTVINP
jgi:hypothetical protein